MSQHLAVSQPSQLFSQLCGQPREQVLQWLQQQVKGQLQIIAGLDHLDESRCDWLPQLQLSLRYDLNDCVQQISLNTRVAVADISPVMDGVKPHQLLADWRARGLPFLNLGNVLHSIAEGISFCFERQRLVQVVYATPAQIDR